MPDHHPVILSAHFPQAAHRLGLLTLRDLLTGGWRRVTQCPGPQHKAALWALTLASLLRDHKYTQTGREGSFTWKSLAAAG